MKTNGGRLKSWCRDIDGHEIWHSIIWEPASIDMDYPIFGCKMYTRNTGNKSSITRSEEPAGIKLAKETKVVGQIPGAYFITHVQHQMCRDQINMCTKQGKLNMYLYKVWAWDFIEHLGISHSILGHFMDRRFLGWRAKKHRSIVMCPTNST